MSIITTPLVVGNIYNFNTIAPGILNLTYTNVKLTGSVSYDVAIKYVNINALHASIYPLLGPSFPNDPAAYTYYLFKVQSGDTICLAADWIDGSTVVVVQSLTLNITITSLPDLADITKILNAIKSLGYTDVTSNTISN
jgi:hypothetical protein